MMMTMMKMRMTTAFHSPTTFGLRLVSKRILGNQQLLQQQRSFARTSIWKRSKPLKAIQEIFAPKVNQTITENVMKVLQYPDPRLRTENEIITTFDESLQQLANDMLATMYADNGIGLAAPQIGVNKRLMVFNEFGDTEEKESEMILANPVIIDKSPLKQTSEEGCLSFPNMFGEVERHYRVTIDYQDLQGMKKKIRLEGYPAVIFQHEYDHLDKILLIDRFSARDKKKYVAKLKEMVDRYGPGAAL